MHYYKMGGSEKHLRDITGMIKVSEELISFEYIETWSSKLNLTEIWEAIKKRIQDKKGTRLQGLPDRQD
ncbi:MAG: hypothetical protein GY757_20890 [bacterium]|nr:hypothetical protein [bacterium]